MFEGEAGIHGYQQVQGKLITAETQLQCTACAHQPVQCWGLQRSVALAAVAMLSLMRSVERHALLSDRTVSTLLAGLSASAQYSGLSASAQYNLEP